MSPCGRSSQLLLSSPTSFHHAGCTVVLPGNKCYPNAAALRLGYRLSPVSIPDIAMSPAVPCVSCSRRPRFPSIAFHPVHQSDAQEQRHPLCSCPVLQQPPQLSVLRTVTCVSLDSSCSTCFVTRSTTPCGLQGERGLQDKMVRKESRSTCIIYYLETITDACDILMIIMRIMRMRMNGRMLRVGDKAPVGNAMPDTKRPLARRRRRGWSVDAAGP